MTPRRRSKLKERKFSSRSERGTERVIHSRNRRGWKNSGSKRLIHGTRSTLNYPNRNGVEGGRCVVHATHDSRNETKRNETKRNETKRNGRSAEEAAAAAAAAVLRPFDITKRSTSTIVVGSRGRLSGKIAAGYFRCRAARVTASAGGAVTKARHRARLDARHRRKLDACPLYF